MEYYSVMKTNGSIPLERTRMDLESAMPSEIIPTGEYIYSMISLTCGS